MATSFGTAMRPLKVPFLMTGPGLIAPISLTIYAGSPHQFMPFAIGCKFSRAGQHWDSSSLAQGPYFHIKIRPHSTVAGRHLS